MLNKDLNMKNIHLHFYLYKLYQGNMINIYFDKVNLIGMICNQFLMNIVNKDTGKADNFLQGYLDNIEKDMWPYIN